MSLIRKILIQVTKKPMGVCKGIPEDVGTLERMWKGPVPTDGLALLTKLESSPLERQEF